MRKQLLIEANQSLAFLTLIVTMGTNAHVSVDLFVLVLLRAYYSSDLSPILLNHIKIGLEIVDWVFLLLIQRTV